MFLLKKDQQKNVKLLFSYFCLLALFGVNLLVISSSIYLYLGGFIVLGFRIQDGEDLLKTRALVTGWRLDQAARRHVSNT